MELGASWKGFGVSWAPFGPIMGRLGGLLGVFWEVLEASSDDFGSILGCICASQAIYENSKKPRKTNGFSLIFTVLEGFRLPKITKKSQKDRSLHLKRPKNPQDGDLGSQECDFTAQVGAKRAILEPKHDADPRKIIYDVNF